MSLTRLFTLTLLLTLLPGCSAYLADYDYFPSPAVVTIPQNLQPPSTQPTPTPPTPPTAAPAMNVLATVIGIRREDSQHHLPQAVELRLRLENGPLPATFDPSQLQLVTESLIPLGPPSTTPAQPTSLSPGQQLSALAFFPLPPGTPASALNLASLRLSVPITINNQPVQAGITFQRLIPYYLYDPYPAYYPYYGPYFYPYPTFYGHITFGTGRRFRR